MENVISFSLWGNDPKYCVGALRNAELAKRHYPAWRCVFQIDALVPQPIADALDEMEHVDVIRRIDPETNEFVRGDWRGTFWRFELVNDSDIDAIILRDCDSRLNAREATAVQEWLEADKGFHLIHDHPYHTVPILGGMWGCRSGALPQFNDLMAQWDQQDRWQTDQEFLTAEIWPRIENNYLNHDAFFTQVFGGKDFTVPRIGAQFVGQVFDEYDRTIQKHIDALDHALPKNMFARWWLHFCIRRQMSRAQRSTSGRTSTASGSLSVM